MKNVAEKYCMQDVCESGEAHAAAKGRFRGKLKNNSISPNFAMRDTDLTVAGTGKL